MAGNAQKNGRKHRQKKMAGNTYRKNDEKCLHKKWREMTRKKWREILTKKWREMPSEIATGMPHQ
jgi:hypothetical protein